MTRLGPTFRGDFDAAKFATLCWAHHLRWTRTNLEALAECLARHGGTPDVGRYDAAAAIHRVDGGFRRKWDGSTVEDKPDLPSLTSEQSDEYLTTALMHAHAHAWAGRTAPTDRAVYCGVVSIANGLEYPPITPSASVRQLAQCTGLHPDTVGRSLSRLTATGYLHRIENAAGLNAAGYLIRWPVSALSGTQSSSFGLGRDSCGLASAPSIGHDHPAFHRSALGKSAHRLLAVLATEGPLQDKEWFTAAGVSRRTFYKLKPRLVGHRSDPALVERSESGWVVRTDLSDRLNDVGNLPAVLPYRYTSATSTAQLHAARDQRFQRERMGHVHFRARQMGVDQRYEIVDPFTVFDRWLGVGRRAR
jgi:hypothetical protein